MSGGGTKDLTGNDIYSGGSNINSGTLQFKGATGTALPVGSAIGLGGGTVSIANDGSGGGGTINVGSNITLTAAVSTTPTVGIDVRGATGINPGNTVAFGVLSMGTTANALFGTIYFTAGNGYRESFAGLNLPGSTGYSTDLYPSGTTVAIIGNVNNQRTAASGGQYDTFFFWTAPARAISSTGRFPTATPTWCPASPATATRELRNKAPANGSLPATTRTPVPRSSPAARCNWVPASTDRTARSATPPR